MAQLIVTAALLAVQTAISMSRKIEGPRLDDKKFTDGDYGAAIPRVWAMRRLACPIFWAEDLREVKRRRKTKGGKYNDYTYYATWGALLAGHQIDGVRRIWFDTHLVYDLSGAGPVTPFEFGKNRTGTQLSDYITIYTGTETQEPDERMQATVEAEFGPGSCPAYRGTAYVVFKDIPLEKLGNRIPQVSVEVVSSATAHWPYETIATLPTSSYIAFSPDYSYLVQSAGFNYALIDTASRSVMIDGALSPAAPALRPLVIPDNDGNLYSLDNADSSLVNAYSPEGVGMTYADTTVSLSSVWGVQDANEVFQVYALASGGTYFHGSEATIGAGKNTGLFADLDGSVWLTSYESSTSVKFQRLGAGTGVDSLTVTGLPVALADVYPAGAVHYRDDTKDHFVFYWRSLAGTGYLHAIDRTTGAILHTYSTTGLAEPSFRDIAPGVQTIWAGFREISLADLSLVRALPLSTWVTGGGGSSDYSTVYDPVNHALIVAGSATLTWYYLDRVGSAGVTLGTIAGDIAAVAGVDPATIDVSDLTQTVDGFSAASGSGKDWLEPLLDIYDVDARPHGFLLDFLNRGGTPTVTLSSDEFARGDSGGGGAGEPLFSATRAGGSDVPAQVTLKFADLAADQQPSVAMSGPIAETDGERVQTLDMTTLALAAGDGRQLVARYHRRLAFDRRSYTLPVSAQQLALEPADLRTLDLRGVLVTARLSSVVLGADRRLQTEWRADDPSINLLDGSTGATFDGRDESLVVVPLLSRGFFLDLPLLRDPDDQATPVLYTAAAPYAAGTWPGAVLYRATGGEYTDELTSVASTAQATWGYTTDTLPDANPNLWDRGSTVNVKLQVGSLTGTTEAAIDANGTLNLCIIGGELVQFTTATLEMDATYTLSGFKRGRRGTEGACGTHAERDVFLLLDTADDTALGLSDVGTNLSFKAITSGRTTGFPVDVEPFTGASLKPYAPCQLRAVKDSGTGDWTLTWTRRTRVGGDWTSGTSIPLSEASEAYVVEIMNGATVVRTITGLTSPTAVWDASMQAADFGGGQSTVSFHVCQISAAVGRGFVATGAA